MSELLLMPARPRVGQSLKLGTLRAPASTQMNGLQVYYPFEEASGLRFDVISNGRGPAAKFVRASSQRLSIADNAALSMGAGVSFTLPCWVYLDNLTNEQAFLAKFNTTGNDRGYLLEFQLTTMRFRFLTSPDGIASDTLVSNDQPSAGQWYCLVVDYNSTTGLKRMFVNNVLNNSNTATAGGVFDNAASFFIGAYQTGTFANLDGRVKFAAVVKGIWTAAERTAYYNHGLGMRYAGFLPYAVTAPTAWWDLGDPPGSRADSAGTNNLTATGTPLVAQGIYGNTLTATSTAGNTAGQIGNCVTLASASSEILIGGDSPEFRLGDNDTEWAGWVYFATVGTDMTILSKDNGAAGGREYRLSMATATKKLTWQVFDGTNSVASVTSTGVVAATTWYYVRVYHDAANDLIGIQINNGAADTASTAGVAPSSGTTTTLRFGANGSGTPQQFNGRLDEWGKWSRLRTSGELTAAYNGGSGLAYPLGGVTSL